MKENTYRAQKISAQNITLQRIDKMYLWLFTLSTTDIQRGTWKSCFWHFLVTFTTFVTAKLIQLSTGNRRFGKFTQTKGDEKTFTDSRRFCNKTLML